MDWTFDRSEVPEFIRVIGGGLFSNDGFSEMFEALFELEYWHHRVPLLLDVRELDFTRTTSLQLLAASDSLIGRNDKLSYTKIAVLIKEGGLGLARRFDSVTKHSFQAWVGFHLDEKKAIDWIAEQRLLGVLLALNAIGCL